jgi:hypothetical protein
MDGDSGPMLARMLRRCAANERDRGQWMAGSTALGVGDGRPGLYVLGQRPQAGAEHYAVMRVIGDSPARIVLYEMAIGALPYSIGIGYMSGRTLLIAALVIVLTGWGMFRLGTGAQGLKTLQKSGVIDVPEEALDFGEAWESRDFAWTLLIENRSGRDVEIKRFVTSCGCIGTEPDSATIAAGQSMTIRLRLSLATRDVTNHDSTRPFSAEVRPVLSDGSSPTTWTIRGRVRRALVFDKPVVDLGEPLVRGEPFPPHTVTVRGLLALAAVEAECDLLVPVRAIFPLKRRVIHRADRSG